MGVTSNCIIRHLYRNYKTFHAVCALTQALRTAVSFYHRLHTSFDWVLPANSTSSSAFIVQMFHQVCCKFAALLPRGRRLLGQQAFVHTSRFYANLNDLVSMTGQATKMQLKCVVFVCPSYVLSSGFIGKKYIELSRYWGFSRTQAFHEGPAPTPILSSPSDGPKTAYNR